MRVSRLKLAMTLKLYGVEPSQPVRSVIWLLEINNIPYELVYCMPGHRKGTRSPDYIKKNPMAHVPFLEDEQSGVCLAEAAAIMVYLANKYKLHDLYPADLKSRALVDEYLHWHHRNTRCLTLAYFAPVVRGDLQLPAALVKSNAFSAKAALKLLENRLATQASASSCAVRRRSHLAFTILLFVEIHGREQCYNCGPLRVLRDWSMPPTVLRSH